MGKKNQARKGRSGAPQGGGAVDSLSADLSDLFKTLPPIKRADLTKTVEKLFQVIRESKRLKPLYNKMSVTQKHRFLPTSPASLSPPPSNGPSSRRFKLLLKRCRSFLLLEFT